MKYENDLMAFWDEYAIKKTIDHDREMARKEGREEGREESKIEVVKSLLSIGKFSISEAANFANVPESLVRKVKKKR